MSSLGKDFQGTVYVIKMSSQFLDLSGAVALATSFACVAEEYKLMDYWSTCFPQEAQTPFMKILGGYMGSAYLLALCCIIIKIGCTSYETISVTSGCYNFVLRVTFATFACSKMDVTPKMRSKIIAHTEHNSMTAYATAFAMSKSIVPKISRTFQDSGSLSPRSG
ncbi:hypothetical protein TNCV_1394921 [Trichonephila clavipes]|nr:hypothetical protein TNCV_1394921 [Trichonephila clavipes]